MRYAPERRGSATARGKDINDRFVEDNITTGGIHILDMTPQPQRVIIA